MQINRLFEIIYILLDKKKVTATQLAEHFGVSRQTICRDIDTLSTAGIPIYTERGKGGGIGLLPSFVLNKSILNKNEQEEILSALHGLSKLKMDDSKQVLHKLSTIFNSPMPNWLEIDFSEWSNHDDFFNHFKTAIIQQKIVEFDYYNSSGDKTFRRVVPIQLWFKSKAWYLKGFCLTKQGVRLYKLLRIKNLMITEEDFNQRDLANMQENPYKWDTQPEITLKLCIDPQMAYRVHDDFIPSEIEKQADGSFIVTTAFTQDRWLCGFLLSYGKHIDVIEPESLKHMIKKEAKEILKKYL